MRPATAPTDTTPETRPAAARRERPRAVVELDGVSRAFPGTDALVDVSLRLQAGEIHALLGPNGAGKTTLLRILAGLLSPTAGSVSVLDARPDRQSRRHRSLVGLVPSGDRAVYLRISGFENLLFFARLYGLRKTAAAARAVELLEVVGLSDAAHTRAGLYSHGMRRRLCVARALIADPALLLADEATHDLDPDGARGIRDLVQATARSGTAVLWATQRLDEIRGFATSATMLASGVVRFTGPVAELLEHASPRRFVLRLRERASGDTPRPSSVAALLGPLGGAEPVPGDAVRHVLIRLARETVLGDALEAISRGGIEILGCSQERSELEEAFFSLMEKPS